MASSTATIKRWPSPPAPAWPSPAVAVPEELIWGARQSELDDAALLRAISDPKWMVNGLRNRDLVARLYAAPTDDPTERRRRSARVTRRLRLLRGHGLLHKVPRTHTLK